MSTAKKYNNLFYVRDKIIFKYFQFNDVRTVDRDFHKRIKRIGLNNKHYKEVIGIHKPRHSIFSNYLKTKSDIEKWKFLKRNYNKIYW